MLLDSRTSPGSCVQGSRNDTPEISSANSSASSITTHENELASLSPSLVPTPTILVTNLPTLLFSQVQDMDPLFCPFGRIKKLEVVDSSSKDSISAIVEYASVAIAQDAKETLHGQCYAGHQLSARYVRSKSPPLALALVSNAAYNNMNASHSFNPYARQSPLLLGTTDPYHAFMHSQRFNNDNNKKYRYMSSGPQHAYSHATHPCYPSDYRQRNISRSSSASSM